MHFIKYPKTLALERLKVNCRVPYDHIPLRSYPLFKARHILEAMLSAYGYKVKRT